MRLKSLEIKGFKSFANETLIHFNEKVTGVVGPNGSGKSNVIDAIRWVLGEQKTSELRLDSMSSVIFNGTKKRKAANMARVAITFDNDKGLLPTEFHTLTISRTLYRSGNSEYRINDVVCRLKDITTLLMETGIGSDTYAIIALGMVDDILSDRDQARRRMMEQAAGIVKFKNRKRETVQKLKGTREDLDRVEDLLKEIEDNLKSLEKQARRTSKYFELKDEYKQLSMNLSAVKFQKVQADRTEILKKIQDETDAYAGKEALIRKEEADLEAMKTDLLQDEQELSGKQKDLAEFIQTLRSRENEKQMLNQRRDMLKKSLGENQQILVRAETQLGEVQQKQAGLDTKVQDQVKVCEDLNTTLTQAETALNEKRDAYAKLKAELSEVLTSQKNLERQVYDLEKGIAIKNNLLEKSKLDIRQDMAFTEQVDKEIAQIDIQQKEKKELVEKWTADIRTVEEREQARKQQLSEVHEQIRLKNIEADQMKRSIAAAQHEYDLTRSMVDNLEGFPESIRFLSKQKDWMQHAVLFSDILYCEDGYRVAVENFLEPWLNHFIVPDRRTAIEGIRYLGNSQKGKAHFIISNAFEGGGVDTPVKEGYLRAIDVVNCDEMYKAVIQYFLKDVYISEQDFSESDNTLIDIDHDQMTVLSKRGDFLYQKKNISGGSVGLFEGKKIGRRKNLEVLEKKIKELKSSLFGLDKTLSSLEDQRTLLEKADESQALQEVRKKLSAAEYDLAQVSARQESLIDKKVQAETKSQQTLVQIEQLEGEAQQLQVQLQAAQEQLAQVVKAIESRSSTSQEWSDVLNEESQAFNQLKIQTIQQSNHLQNLKREETYLREQIQRLQEDQVKSANQIKVLESEINATVEKNEAIDAAILELIEAKKVSEQDLGEREQSYYKRKMDIQKLEQKLRATNHEMLQQQNLINQMKEKANDYKFAINALEERIRIEFEESLRDFIAESEQTETAPVELGEAEVKIDKIKAKLSNFGEINPMAVEAFNEIKVRYDQINEQRADILEAEKSLLQTIKEVEETAKIRFLDAFEKIRVHFVDVFRSLFTEEDFCDIYLEDPDDPLESPIQIVARPKGKKPQTLQQLSGGEKTLTATALLFSFYLLKPAPFCIFDEVDAPLDDANIDKFNKIIQHFSDNSQFIVVTHNRGTMASVDVIYGVYMEEQGVSGLSPVDFRKFKHSGMLESVGQ